MPFTTLLGFPPSGPMPLGHTLPPKGGVDEPPQDLADLGRKKNEAHEGPNIFNNQMGPIGELVVLFESILAICQYG